MPARKGLLAPQNTFLDTIATRFDGTHSNFVLGNAKIAINPIVYCSDGFCDLTGYSRAQIMQKSCACNFLYGPKTDVQHKEAISRALEQKQELKLEVILYKSTRTPFWCLLDIVPIQDEKHEVVLFLCSHKDITKQKLHEEKEHEFARLLNAQKQQKLADHHLHPSGQQQVHPSQQQQQHLPPNQHHQPETGGPQHDATAADASAAPEDTKLDEANEAELSALANQNALISMDEFELEDLDDENEFDDLDGGEDHDKHTASQYSRRRSRAVLYQLSGHYGCRRSVNMKSKLKLNNRMNIPEYKTTTIEKQRFILSHYGVGKSCWDWLILIVSFYVAIVVPYNATFKDKQQDLSGECKIDSIDMIVEVVFIIDVILNFRTTFVNRKGEVVTRPKIICKHYIRGWFVVDACAAVPFDLLCSLNLYSRSRLDLNLLKLIRLLRLARLLQKMDRYSQYSYIILTLLMLIFSLLAHWCACIWYVIAMEEIERNPPEWKIGWIHQLSDKLGYSVVNTTDMASSYVTALYFTTSSLTSVGFGNVSANTNAEKIFSIVIMLIGALMHAVVFGNVTALIRVMYARRSNYQTRLRDLKDFFRLHQLPKELQQRMSDYFQTTWSLNHGIETYEILKDFPEELRGDVSLHLHREVLSLPIFETAPQGFLKSLARHIESKFCCPTEYLIHRRDALNYLYLVCNGSMEVLQDNMVVAILGKGDLVGYDVNAVITPEHTQYGGLNKAGSMMGPPMGGLVKSSSDLKALTYCDLKCIHISGLLDVLKLYPEFSDTFHREIIHDLSFNLRENHEEQIDEMTDDEEANALGSPMDEDGYDGPPTNGRGPRGGGGGPTSNGGPRSPPPNIGHLYRSITSNENQIGRYDHDEDLEEEEAGEGDEGDDEEEGDEEDDELEEDDDGERDDREEEEEEPGGNNDGGDPGGGGSGNHNGDASGGSGAASNGANGGGPAGGQNGPTRHRNGRSAGGGGRNGASGPVEGGVAAAAASGGAPNGLSETSSASTGNGTDTSHLLDLRRSFSDDDNDRVAAGIEPAAAADILGGRTGLRRRMIRAQDDWQSAHSYDGLMDSSRARDRAKTFRRATGASSIGAINNHTKPLLNDEMMAQETAALVGGGSRMPAHGSMSHPASSPRLRSAIGGAQRAQQGPMAARKPPLSFDLSRNTTAIVDRRRRSAGCIPRPLLMGAVASAAGGGCGPAVPVRANHSSLLHINEEPSSNGSQISTTTSKRSNTAAAAAVRRSQTNAPLRLSRSNGCAAGAIDSTTTMNYSNQDLNNIDTRITGISASVTEMKQELRMEMSQIRGTIQLLMQLLDKQAQQQQQQPQGRAPNNVEQASSGATRPQSFMRPSASLHSMQATSSLNQVNLATSSHDIHTKRGQAADPRQKPAALSNDEIPKGSTGSVAQSPGGPKTPTLLESLSVNGVMAAAAQPFVGGGNPPPPAASPPGQLGPAPTKPLAPIVDQQRADIAHQTPKQDDVSQQQHHRAADVVATRTRQQQPIIHPPPETPPPYLDARPLSECSMPGSKVAEATSGDLRQSSSGANLNNSDNDSGRSSSSVNSSSNLLGHRNGGSAGGAANEQVLPLLPVATSSSAKQQQQQQQPPALALKQLVVSSEGPTMISGQHPFARLSSASGGGAPPSIASPLAKAASINNNNSMIGGRPAKVFLTEGDTNQSRRYTIDIGGASTTNDVDVHKTNRIT